MAVRLTNQVVVRVVVGTGGKGFSMLVSAAMVIKDSNLVLAKVLLPLVGLFRGVVQYCSQTPPKVLMIETCSKTYKIYHCMKISRFSNMTRATTVKITLGS